MLLNYYELESTKLPLLLSQQPSRVSVFMTIAGWLYEGASSNKATDEKSLSMCIVGWAIVGTST